MQTDDARTPDASPSFPPEPLAGMTDDPASYTTHYANALRNSRVAAPPRRYAALEKVVAVSRAPRFVLVHRAAPVIVIESHGAYALLERGGREVRRGSMLFGESMCALSDRSLFVDGMEVSFGSAVPERRVASAEPPLLALRVGERRAAWMAHLPGNREVPRGFVVVGGGRRAGVDGGADAPWREQIAGEGHAVVDADFRVALALEERRFVIFSADGDAATGGGIREVDVPLGFAPYEISRVGDGFALLEKVGEEPVDGGDPLLPAPTRWKTRVHVVDPHGHERWQATVPFSVLEPPIAGRGSRLYLAGEGIAAVEAGRVAWTHASARRILVTAFDDGTLAATTGSRVEIVDADGPVLQHFQSPGGDDFRTPPAIASDGTVWLGTGSDIFLLR